MIKPIIGIVARPNKSITNRDIYSVSEPLRKRIVECGGIPVGIVPTDENASLFCFLDGLIFPGGTDPIDNDFVLMQMADTLNVPVLGICLGMQTMGIYDGADCVKIDETVKQHYEEVLQEVHEVSLTTDSKLYEITRTTKFPVNSRHHETITKELNHLKIVGMSPDGIIEAVENREKMFWLGVQWHPEDLIKVPLQNDIFLTFIKCAEEYREKGKKMLDI